MIEENKKMKTRRMGRITVGLYNTYDKNRLHDIHIRTVARASPVCYAFGMNLALFGFPFKDKPSKIVEELSASTTISDGVYIKKLYEEGRLFFFDFINKGFPPQLGLIVATTSKPDEKKSISFWELIEICRKGKSLALIIGLGRKGLPKNVREIADCHLDITSRGISLETCTAIGAIPAMFYAVLNMQK